MNKLFKHILIFFVGLVAIDILFKYGSEDPMYFVQPFKYFGITLLMSLIGGYLTYRVMGTIKKPEENIEPLERQ